MEHDWKVVAVSAEMIEDFLVYLRDHISDNGRGDTPLFIPISRKDEGIPEEVANSFRMGVSLPLGEAGWRRAFIAVDEKKQIMGHIDLKSSSQPY